MRRTLATLVLVGLGLGTAGCGGDDSASDPSSRSTPEVTVLELEPGVGAKCRMPDARTLSGFTEAFSGTVTRVEGAEATLDVDHWYAGGDAPEVVVRTSRKPITEAGLFTLEKGERYLISGSQGSVSLCGFSAAWSPDLERLYSQAFATTQ